MLVITCDQATSESDRAVRNSLPVLSRKRGLFTTGFVSHYFTPAAFASL